MTSLASSVGGVTVSMVAFQAVDPGSTPGRRTSFFFFFFFQIVFLPQMHKWLKEEEETLIFYAQTQRFKRNPQGFCISS